MVDRIRGKQRQFRKPTPRLPLYGISKLELVPVPENRMGGKKPSPTEWRKEAIGLLWSRKDELLSKLVEQTVISIEDALAASIIGPVAWYTIPDPYRRYALGKFNNEVSRQMRK